jgi:hypothetical protein
VDLIEAAPSTIAGVQDLLARATASAHKVLVRGAGTHQGYGYAVEPDVTLSTARLNRILAWEPDDLTVVVEPGVAVSELEQLLATKNQTALLPEGDGPGTVGGVLAAGLSGYRRARYGPTRDRVLETTIVTGDGRVVRGGARVVKNVTGYDLPRLVVGSFGSLGVIVSTCLKLWPRPRATATVILDPATEVAVYRPLAVLETPAETRIYLGGTPEEVEAQARQLGGSKHDGLHWPAPIRDSYVWSLRVVPSHLPGTLRKLPDSTNYIAQVRVGEVTFGTGSPDGIVELRAWTEALGGSLINASRPDSDGDPIDPWGEPPSTIDLQRRLISGFDPARVVNPGRLPGRI